LDYFISVFGIKRDLGTITPKTLTKELKYLEMNKLVLREANLENSNSVIYSLTKHGRT
jgi:DNA-binding HxlR family transcriptional regulator